MIRNIIIGIVIAILAGLTFGVYQYQDQKYKEELKAKILDYEIQSYNIISKDVISKNYEEPYNCILVNSLNSPLAMNVEQVKSSSKSGSSSKSTTKPTPTPKVIPKTTPKSNSTSPPPRSNNKNKNNDGSYDHDTDVAPDDNLINPLKGRAPNNKKWRCLYQTKTKYDFVMKDSANNSYTFATNSLDKNLIPEGWNEYQVGSPIAKKVEYENYFLAGTDPIFSTSKNQNLDLKDKLIQEPNPYGKFNLKINQVHQIDINYSNEIIKEFNQELMNTNSELNNKDNKKQVNLQMYLLQENMDDYVRQLCLNREGCNKNDFILTIQMNSEKKVTRIQGYSWSSSAYPIALKLDSEYVSQNKKILGVNEFKEFLNLLKAQIKEKFERKEMSEFKYIKEELERQIKKN
jgi:hypothetical protein